MGRAKRLAGGTRSTGLAIEYVRTRKVVRILGWLSETPIEPVEIPVEELYRSLGISPRDIGAPQQFLLFAGSHRQPGGGLRDLVGTFGDEEEAWAAFRDLRQSQPSVEGWAELAAMDGVGHVNQLAWFGLHQAPELRNLAPAARVVAVAEKRPAHRPAAGAEHPAYLRAVTPS